MNEFAAKTFANTINYRSQALFTNISQAPSNNFSQKHMSHNLENRRK